MISGRIARHLCVLCAFAAVFCSSGAGLEGAETVKADEVARAIRRSADYLLKSVERDGSFIYRINMDSGVRVKKKYNILRHAGTIYSMCLYYQSSRDQRILPALRRSGNFLCRSSIAPLSGRDDVLAVWSRPEVTFSKNPLQAKLGGAGLALVAMLSIDGVIPGFARSSDLRKIGNFILYMQKEDGSFCSKYIPSEGGRQDDWQSLYYPGEAALGLLMLYEKDPLKIWLESAEEALAYLAEQRTNKRNVPADHWTLLATDKLLSLKQDKQTQSMRDLFVDHAVQICEGILQEQIVESKQQELVGGFSRDGRVTPTSTRLEGLLACLAFLPPDHPLRERIRAASRLGIAFLLRAQIKGGRYSGAFPRAMSRSVARSREGRRFDHRATEVRIDYVQHALSAMIQYQLRR